MIPLLFTILSFSPVTVHHTAPVTQTAPAPMVGAAVTQRSVVPDQVSPAVTPKAPAPSAPPAPSTTTTANPDATGTAGSGSVVGGGGITQPGGGTPTPACYATGNCAPVTPSNGTTSTTTECVVVQGPPNSVATFSGGPADASGSCAAVAAQYPNATSVTPEPFAITS